MDVINAIVLGIVEGLTEFLPVSSTGHLILTEHVLHVDGDQPPWSVLLWVSQFAAILAVVLYFWRDLWKRTFRPRTRFWEEHLLTKLAAAMLPTVVLALLFKKLLDPLENSSVAVAGALLVGAVIMEFIDRKFRRNVPQDLEHVSIQQAFLIGVIQCLAMWPGVSRAGATIMGGMVLGLTPRVATEFSFYLAIPTMLAAAGKTLWSHRAELNAANAGLILVGSAVAFVVALIVVAAFMGYVRRYRFTPFAIYRAVLGAAVLLVWLANR
jgi:undecaprenyl-diphosphatase